MNFTLISCILKQAIVHFYFLQNGTMAPLNDDEFEEPLGFSRRNSSEMW